MFIEFIHQEEVPTELLKYKAGRVCAADGRGFKICYEQKGAAETFSVGQPVYDEDNNLMGYMDIKLYEGLNYADRRNGEKIPVFSWGIGKPTKHCVAGKKVFTYWQRWSEDSMQIMEQEALST